MLTQKTSRRGFLKITASSVLPLFIAGSFSGCGESGIPETLVQHLIGLLNYPDEASKIGRLYIEEYSELKNRSFQKLTNSLLSSLDNKKVTEWENNLTALDSSIHDKVRQDFRDENVVILKGWMLSKTEATLCAICSNYKHNIFALIT